MDGYNPVLSGAWTSGSDNFNAAMGIASFYGYNSIRIENNIVENDAYAGIDLESDGPGSPPTMNNCIAGNLVRNMDYNTEGYGFGITLYNNDYAKIANNYLTNDAIAISPQSYFLANPGSVEGQLIESNNVSASLLGIWLNLSYESASTFYIRDNISSYSPTNGSVLYGPVEWDGIELTAIQTAAGAVASNNVVTGSPTNTGYNVVGYNIWDTPTTNEILITGGTISNTTYGVWVNDYDGYQSATGATAATIAGVSITGSSLAGVYVQNDPRAQTLAPIQATVTSNTVISGSAVGVLVQGTNAGASVVGNTASITDDQVGVWVDTGVALLENNDLRSNSVAGILATNGAIVDAGNCTGTNVTGLGMSTGGNNLSGYAFTNTGPFAIANYNPAATPVVLAEQDNFGAMAGTNIANDFYGASGVVYSQSPELLVAPTNVTCDLPIRCSRSGDDFSRFDWSGRILLGSNRDSLVLGQYESDHERRHFADLPSRERLRRFHLCGPNNHGGQYQSTDHRIPSQHRARR